MCGGQLGRRHRRPYGLHTNGLHQIEGPADGRMDILRSHPRRGVASVVTGGEQMGEVSDSQLIALACRILELSGQRKRRLLEADNQVDRFMLVYEDLYRHLDDKPEVGSDPSETLN